MTNNTAAVTNETSKFIDDSILKYGPFHVLTLFDKNKRENLIKKKLVYIFSAGIF